ncbi:MAG: alkaline phosphatase family protein [Prevotella sp.]|nr:alkaline phosphatase family protein [Prevotella sp.]
MIRKLFFTVVLFCAAAGAVAQSQFGEKPRLVVGVVVDQMRWDYLSRYYDRFAPDGGLRRLIDQGFSCNNCLINYVPTTTAIGHTSAYTGSTPALHGICGNNFFVDGHKVYCTRDDSVQPVGANDDKGRMSPRLLLATTIGDQLRLHTDFRSRVIGISYKDRAAILPAGHSANAAYWLSLKQPVQFITSTYYMAELPQWVKQYNRLLAGNASVQAAGSDIGLRAECGTVITDMAIATLEGEQLGKGDDTDMLCVSYSQTDVIGHRWGTRGEHTDEAYLQLDRDLGRLLSALDSHVGEGNYLLFLTADHGAAHNWAYMQEHNLSAGPWSSSQMKQWIGQELAAAYGDDGEYIADVIDYRIFLDWQKIRERGRNGSELMHRVLDLVRQREGVTFAAIFSELSTTAMPPQMRDRAIMGYHPGRSGDIIFFPRPGFYEHGSWSSPTGTTHGEWNPYDTHIPCLFYGWKVAHGATSREVHITDIAPTVCQLLHIQQPNACVGEAITEITH